MLTFDYNENGSGSMMLYQPVAGEDGSVLPFFEKGQARTTLTLSCG